ncbi:MAG TPA: M23 family metallopeptidase, partial [Anaerolineales bacterium]|nr:M23 family metallopeptidase [Anaerolineales bacterium]
MFPTRDPSATSTIVPTYLPISDLPAPHFWLDRPISDEYNDYVIPTYRYGSTQGGTLRVHHGVDFVNSLGTPIKSAISGKVVFAGSDYYAKLGPTKDFYGRAIIVHAFDHFLHQPVFVLYGHLDTILVSKGQTVETGTILGTVGGAGVAKGGSHLHMEIRIGHNDYLSTRNPELWIRPYPDWGTLA